MRVSSSASTGDSNALSILANGAEMGGFQLVRACSMAWDVLSSSVRRTVALIVSPIARADLIEALNDKRCERRWIIGHRSVARPRRVSTALKGEFFIERFGLGSGDPVGNV
jgi:hypothetical protein